MMKKLALYALVSVSLFGCGGSDSSSEVVPIVPPAGDNNNPNPPVETAPKLLTGFYSGGSEGDIVESLIDDNNKLWALYIEGDDVLGFVSSNTNLTLNNGEFAVKGKNYSYDARNAFDITITGDYKTPKVLKGTTFDVPSNSITYSARYNEARSAIEQKLAKINNKSFYGVSYTTGDTSAGTTRLNFSDNGNFTGTGEGCNMTGKFTLSASKRYFDATVTFGPAPCFSAGETHTGVALIDQYNELIILSKDKNNTKGSYFNTDI